MLHIEREFGSFCSSKWFFGFSFSLFLSLRDRLDVIGPTVHGDLQVMTGHNADEVSPPQNLFHFMRLMLRLCRLEFAFPLTSNNQSAFDDFLAFQFPNATPTQISYINNTL